MGTKKAWITTHETVERTMTFDFGIGIKVIVDWNFEKVYKMVNGEVKPEDIHEMSEFTISSLEEMLVKVESEISAG